MADDQTGLPVAAEPAPSSYRDEWRIPVDASPNNHPMPGPGAEKQAVLDSVREDPLRLSMACDAYRSDPDIVLAAMESDLQAVMFAHPSLFTHPAILEKLAPHENDSNAKGAGLKRWIDERTPTNTVEQVCKHCGVAQNFRQHG